MTSFFGGMFVGFILAAFLIMMYANYDPYKPKTKFKFKSKENTKPATPAPVVNEEESEMTIDEIIAEYK